MSCSSNTQSQEDSGERPKSEEGEIVVGDDVACGNAVSRMRMQCKYSEGQWSPINPRGKKQYDRDFLLQLQNSVLGQQKPTGMLDIPDIYFYKPHKKPQPEKIDQPGDADFVCEGGIKTSRGAPIEPAIQEHPETSLQENSEPTSNGLHKAKEPWKPRHLRKAKEIDGKPSETEELFNKARSILNKLTPQKFQTLVSQMQALPIDSEDKLKGVVDLVFEWAVNMPLYSAAYANMCRCLSRVPSDFKPGEKVNFGAVLLTRCQLQFEKDCPSKKLLLAKRKNQIEDAANNDVSTEDLEHETAKAKKRSLGNIRFIGELFKLKMFTENIMHDCVFILLRTKEPKHLECLCRLLTTIGKELDVDKAKPRMNQYFSQMSKIINDKKTKPRVKFMLMDVMDLRTNKWVPRRVENIPKTIDQIHKEVAQEAQEKALISQQNRMAARSQIRGGGGGGRRGPPGQMGGSQDGWNTVASNRTPLKSVDRAIDPSKIKMSYTNTGESAAQLEQGGGASTSDMAGIPMKRNEKPIHTANEATIMSLSRQETNTSTAQRSHSGRTMLSDEIMERKTKSILYNYFAGQDLEEAVVCVKEMSTQEHHHFVLFAIHIVLERSSSARQQTGQLLHDLIKQNVLSVDSYFKGLADVLMFAEDLENDNPSVWQYHGELIRPLIQDGTVPLRFIKLAAQPLLANKKAVDVLSELTGGALIRKQNVDESAIQLGPGGGASRFAGWGRGSTGGTIARLSQEKEKPNTPANRFLALCRPEEEAGRRYSGGVSPARGDSRGRGSRGFGRPPNLSARLSQESERERAVAAAKAIGSSQSVDGSHRERSRGRAEQERQPSPAQPSSSEIKLLSADEMEKKTKAILDEYFAVQDMKEAILCVQVLSAQNHHQFVLYAINHVLERSSTARKQTGHVLHDLVKQKVISVDNYIKGLVEVLEFAEDLEIDITKIWQYYGEMISPMIQDNSVPLSFLKQAAQPLIANNKAGVLLAEILHDASHREGHKKVAGLWTSSGLHWSDFVPKNQVEQFLKVKGLEFTNGGDSAPTTPTIGLPLKDIETKLNDLIVQKKADNEKVFDWIEGNVDDPTTKQPKFIRALMTAVCTSAIKGEKGKERLQPKEISNRNDLLQKYLDHQAETELQALYALQALITKLEHPQGILRGMFDTLYDEDIISEDAFFQWEKSEEEPKGKGSCLKQAVQFFTWLREAEDDS